MNVAQIKTELKDRGIDFRPNAPGEKLLELLNDTLAAGGEEIVELDGAAPADEPEEETKKPSGKKVTAKRSEPGPRKGTQPSKAEAAIKNTSVPAVPLKKKKKSFLPNVKAKEFENLELKKGSTVKIFMLNNINNGSRFKQGVNYIVPKDVAEQFINEGWAE